MLAGCTTVPHSTLSEDAAAKTFQTKPNVANLYIYRESSFVGAAVGWDVLLDGRTLAVLTTGTYVFTEVEPGQHTLSQLQDVFPIRLDASRNNFIRLEPTLLSSGTRFRQVSEQQGRDEISKLPRVITLY